MLGIKDSSFSSTYLAGYPSTEKSGASIALSMFTGYKIPRINCSWSGY